MTTGALNHGASSKTSANSCRASSIQRHRPHGYLSAGPMWYTGDRTKLADNSLIAVAIVSVLVLRAVEPGVWGTDHLSGDRLGTGGAGGVWAVNRKFAGGHDTWYLAVRGGFE